MLKPGLPLTNYRCFFFRKEGGALYLRLLSFSFLFFTVLGLANEKNFRFQHFTPKQGLAQSTVYCIIQDRQGFMWFGTPSGLNRYDGYQFKTYMHDPREPESLSEDRIKSLLEDSQGRLWIGTFGGGLNLFDRDKNRFIRYRHDPGKAGGLIDDDIHALFETQDGQLWIGTGKGLVCLDADLGRFYAPELITSENPKIFSGLIRAIYEDSAGMLWIGVNGQGLVRYDRGNHSATLFLYEPDKPYGLASNHVKVIREDKTGSLWIGHMKGLQRFDRETEKFILYQNDPEDLHSLAHDHVTDLWIGLDGRLWVGAFGGGLHRYENAGDRFTRIQSDPDNPNSLSNDKVLSVFEDRTGILWVGSDRGSLNKGNPISWRFHCDRLGFKGQNQISIISLLEDQDQNLWIGALGNGLSMLDPKTGKRSRFLHDKETPHSLSNDYVLSLLEDKQNNFWLGTSGGLNRLDRKTRQFEAWRHDPDDPSSISSDHVFSILQDRSGKLWLGTQEGLNHFNPKSGKARHYQPEPKDPTGSGRNRIWHMLESQQGQIWLATFQGGLLRMDPEKPGEFLAFRNSPDNPNSISNDRVWHLLEDAERILWIGTGGGGLNRFDPVTGSFTHYREEQGLPSNSIMGILPDASGDLWISTTKGLAHFNPKTGKSTAYDAYDGVLHEEFSPRSCFRNSRGKMYFGAVTGLVTFFPEDIKPDPNPPAMVLTDFHILGDPALINPNSLTGLQKTIEQTESLTLSHKDNMFSLEFAALHFAVPEKNRYAYKLEGVDKDWRYTDASNRIATYTRLDHGAYRFRVKGGNRDGVWNEEGRTLDIRILAPPWLTWWAKTLYLIGLTSLFSLIIYLISSRKKLEFQRALNARFQRLDKLKDHFLTGVSHELRTPLDDIINLAESFIDETSEDKTSKAVINLSMIAHCGRRLSTMVDNFLDATLIENQSLTLHPKVVDLYSLVEVVMSLFSLRAKTRKLKLINAIDPGLAPIHADEDRTYQILHNLIGNAVKCTEMGSVRVSASVEGAFIRVGVVDTGPGLKPEELACLFEPFNDSETTHDIYKADLGLILTRDLIELHGGRLKVDSAPGKGNAFSFTLPLSREKDPKNVQNHLIPSYPILSDALIENAPPSTSDEDCCRLLVADDERVNQMVILNILEPRGYRVTVVNDGVEALSALGENHFDLALLDIMMPGMSGFEVCRLIRKKYSAQELPVLFLTAQNQGIDLVTGFESGGNDYLTKPMRKGELLTRVKLHYDLTKSYRALESKVTERTIEERKIHEDKTRFFENISNQLRTPLTLLSAPLKDLLADRSTLNGRDKTTLTRMERQVDLLTRLIDQLTDISKLETGKMMVQASPADVVAFVEQCIDSFDESARQKGVELTFHPSLPDLAIQFDQDKLEKILFNLLSNALAFTDRNGKVLVALEEERSGVEITIRDTGKGISKERLEHIFDRFDHANQKSVTSAGLGLAISRQLARLHGGDLHITSEEGFGTEVTLYLPGRTTLSPTDGKTDIKSNPIKVLTQIERSRDAEIVENQDSADTPNILLVEDHEELRAYVKEILSPSYQVAEAENGQAGVEWAIQNQPDLIICDVIMPQVDGYALCRQLKEIPETSLIPIILLTAKSDFESRIKGWNEGADDYLVKPFNPRELVARVASLIKARREIRERFSQRLVLKSSNVSVTSEDGDFLQKAIHIVESHLGEENFGVRELAEDMALSERQLRRKLKTLTRQGPAIFIRELRLKIAARMLAEKAGSVAEIAYKVGFKKPQYFSNLFRDHYGVSPSAYAANSESQVD